MLLTLRLLFLSWFLGAGWTKTGFGTKCTVKTMWRTLHVKYLLGTKVGKIFRNILTEVSMKGYFQFIFSLWRWMGMGRRSVLQVMPTTSFRFNMSLILPKIWSIHRQFGGSICLFKLIELFVSGSSRSLLITPLQKLHVPTWLRMESKLGSTWQVIYK